MEMYSSELFSSEFLREKFENDLEILGKLREFISSKMWPLDTETAIRLMWGSLWQVYRFSLHSYLGLFSLHVIYN